MGVEKMRFSYLQVVGVIQIPKKPAIEITIIEL